MQKVISGIQQIGIGIPNVHEAWRWYRRHFGMNIPVFEEAAPANLMVNYTGGKAHHRHAVLAINLQGGGGFEIWQFTSRQPRPPATPIQLGDYGIFATKIKSRDVAATYQLFKSQQLNLLGPPQPDPAGNLHFFLRDPYQNLFQVVPSHSWFKKSKTLTGGSGGCLLGVSDINQARRLYSEVLGYDQVVYDQEEVFTDFNLLPGGEALCRRVLLQHSQPRQGGFSRLLGPSELELIQVLDRPSQKIYQNRFWGDLGFIHLCYDIINMPALEAECRAKGFPFTINSRDTFDMGEAAGQFAYIEDPDGTLIEFVETHRIPILKKFGWYLNLKNRSPTKALPNWLLKTLSFNQVKD